MASLLNENTQKAICEIINADPILLSVHLDAYSDYITAVTVTRVTALLTKWDDNDLDTNFIRIHPKEKNFGVEINPEDMRDNIREALASLLMLHRAKWYAGTGSGTEMIMERG